MTSIYEGYINSVVLDIREKTLSLMKKNLARLAWEQSSCALRTDLKSDVCAYVCMSCIYECVGSRFWMLDRLHT
jgi:hypothetical protein